MREPIPETLRLRLRMERAVERLIDALDDLDAATEDLEDDEREDEPVEENGDERDCTWHAEELPYRCLPLVAEEARRAARSAIRQLRKIQTRRGAAHGE